MTESGGAPIKGGKEPISEDRPDVDYANTSKAKRPLDDLPKPVKRWAFLPVIIPQAGVTAVLGSICLHFAFGDKFVSDSVWQTLIGAFAGHSFVYAFSVPRMIKALKPFLR